MILTDPQRRTVLKSGSGALLLGMLLAAGLLPGGEAQAGWNSAAFAAEELNAVLQAMGAEEVSASDELAILAPEIAENGAEVPIGVTSKLADTEYIAILVENNPRPLGAAFILTPQSVPTVQTRFKMGQTSFVRTVVKAGGRLYTARREVIVTRGGCGF